MNPSKADKYGRSFTYLFSFLFPLSFPLHLRLVFLVLSFCASFEEKRYIIEARIVFQLPSSSLGIAILIYLIYSVLFGGHYSTFLSLRC